MQSWEIIKKYTEKKFIQVDTFVAKEYATVEKLENLIEIDDAFLFTEDLLSEEEATGCIVDSSLDMAVDALLNNSTTFLSRTEARDLVDDVECEYGEELAKKCKIKSAHFLTIRSLKYNIEYKDNQVDIDSNKQEKIINWILDKCEEIKEARAAANAQELDTIKNFILAYKQEYAALTSQNAKTKFVKNLQFRVKDKFETSDKLQRFTIDYIDFILSDSLY